MSTNQVTADLSSRIYNTARQVPDFPKPGINFYDVTTVLADGHLLTEIIDSFCQRLQSFPKPPTAIIGIESRGFIFGAAIAARMRTSFVPVRKPGKLPAETHAVSYDLEYGDATLEIHTDALTAEDRVVIVDDLLATGGTAAATAKLVEKLGAEIIEFAFVFELSFLNGREKLAPHAVHSLVECKS